MTFLSYGHIRWFNMTKMSEQLVSPCFWSPCLQTTLPSSIVPWKKKKEKLHSCKIFSPFSATILSYGVALLNICLTVKKTRVKRELSQMSKYFLLFEGSTNLRVKIPSLLAFCFLLCKSYKSINTVLCSSYK